MANTTNFNWPTPADTDLVKDGAAAIRNLGDGVDTSLVDLKGGTTGQILSKASDTDMDFAFITPNVGDLTEVQAGVGISIASGTGPIPVITNSSTDLITTAGDLLYGTAADTVARIGIGTAGQVLQVNSGATAPEWAAPTSASGPTFRAFRDATAQSLTISTSTKVAFNGETWDTDSCYDPTTNFRFTANKAGYYQFNTNVGITTTGTVGRTFLRFYKNGSEFTRVWDGPTPQAYEIMGGSCLIYLNGTTDYVEVYAFSATATTREIDFGASNTSFDGVWIRS